MSSNPESPAESGDDHAALYDFVYLDRPRIDAFHAQLSEHGALTATKVSEQTERSRRRSGRAEIPHLLGGSIDTDRSASQTYERQYDPSLLAAIDTVERLDDEGSIHRDLATATVGTVIVVEGDLEVVDVRLLRDMWDFAISFAMRAQIDESAVTSAIQTGTKHERDAARRTRSALQQQKVDAEKNIRGIAEIVKHLPHPLQATISTTSESFWSVLDVEHFIGSPESFALQHGSQIAGRWSMIAIIDARPDPLPLEDPFSGSASNIAGMLLQVQGFVRQQFGRPWQSYGVTPLMIYRSIARGTFT